MDGNFNLWVILGVVNIPVHVLIGRLFYSSLADFGEAVRFWFTPDIISAPMGEWHDDFFAEFKLFLWLLVCAAALFAEHQILVQFFLT